MGTNAITQQQIAKADDHDLLTALICLEYMIEHHPEEFAERRLELAVVQNEVARRPAAIALLTQAREDHRRAQQKRDTAWPSACPGRTKPLPGNRVLARP